MHSYILYTYITLMLKIILQWNLETGNLVRGRKLTNMGCWRTTCGPEKPGGNVCTLSQKTELLLRSLFLWGDEDIVEWIKEG